MTIFGLSFMARKQGLALLIKSFIVAGAFSALRAHADTYSLPPGGGVVGAITVASSEYEDTIPDIAYVYDQGFTEMRLANPNVDAWIPGRDTEIIIPSQYVLPEAPREGIVINVPEMRLYYYPRAKPSEPAVVITHPLSVGRQDLRTPIGLNKVVAKVVDPPWYPPETIREEHAADGDILPKMVPPGPDNPLGRYALRLAHGSYLIHWTNKPYGIGMRVTHGCLRLYPKDIESLYSMVPVGTPVHIVNQPFKLGWLNGVLYLEVHPYLDEEEGSVPDDFTNLSGRITTLAQAAGLAVDWDQVQKIVSEKTGIPTAITGAGSQITETVQTELLTNEGMEPETIRPEPTESSPDSSSPYGF